MNNNWTIEATWAMVGALGTWAAVLVAVIAAGFIAWQIKQARALAEEQARPYVIVWVDLDSETRTTLELHIKNVGQTAARNVSVNLDPPHEWTRPTGDMRFMNAAIFTQGLATMPPGWEVTLAMEFVRDIAKDDQARPMTATVSYEDRRGSRHSDEFALDLAYLRGALWLDKHGIHHIAKSVRGIAMSMGVNSF